jgi:hypothetical protein
METSSAVATADFQSGMQLIRHTRPAKASPSLLASTGRSNTTTGLEKALDSLVGVPAFSVARAVTLTQIAQE